MNESVDSMEAVPRWDEFLLTKLNDDTANQIISRYTTGTQKERLVENVNNFVISYSYCDLSYFL